jgi:hypothetical protein
MDAMIAQFIHDRDDALLSLDERRIRAFIAKWRIPWTPDPEWSLWIAVHKARTGAKTLPMDARSLSKQWLTERGFSSLDDGDVPVPASAPSGDGSGEEGE